MTEDLEKPEEMQDGRRMSPSGQLRPYVFLGAALLLTPFGIAALLRGNTLGGIVILGWAGVGLGIGAWRVRRHSAGLLLAHYQGLRVAAILLVFLVIAGVFVYQAFLELDRSNLDGALIRLAVAAGALYIVALAIWQRISGRHP